MFFSYLLKKKNNNLLKRIYSYVKIFVLLVFLWCIFSANKKLFLVVCGFVAIVITFIICIHSKTISYDSYVIKRGFFKYVFLLMKDIIFSTIHMIKDIYSDKIIINPGTIMVNTEKLNDQEKVMFSNLITMTPGTFVIAINGNEFLIHALNRNDFENGKNNKLTALFNKMRKQ